MQAQGVSTTLARAFASLRQGRLQDAESLCRSVLAATPNDADAVHLLGLVLKQAGRLAEAEEPAAQEHDPRALAGGIPREPRKPAALDRPAA